MNSNLILIASCSGIIILLLGILIGGELRDSQITELWQQKIAATPCGQFNPETSEFELQPNGVKK